MNNTLKISGYFSACCAALLMLWVAVCNANDGANDGTAMEESSAPIGTTSEPSTASGTTANGENNPRFDLFEIRVTGNSKLPQEAVERSVYPFLGESKTIEDVDQARAALEKAYHAAGYLTVLVDIPEQDVNNNVVVLNVTEGRVGRLRVKNAHYYALGRIKALAASVQEGQVPHFPTVQDDMTKLNRTADRRVTPVMKPGKTFGTVDVELKVEDSLPWHGSLELNNRYNRDTSHTRLSGSMRYDNLWQRDHSLTLGFQVTPERTSEIQVLSANYLARFDDTNALLALYAIHSQSSINSVASVGGLNVLGDGVILGFRWIKPLPSVDNYSHNVSAGLDYKDFGQSQRFGSDAINNPVTYVPLSVQYSANLKGDSWFSRLSSTATFGLGGFMADETDFHSKREGSSPDFVLTKLDLQHTQAIYQGFQGFVKLGGQFTDQPLIQNEQYLAGGLDTVRGYIEAEVVGDRAIYSTLELRSPPLFRGLSWLQEAKLTAFYDYAQVRRVTPSNQTPSSSPSSEELAGAGVGFRIKAWKRLNASLDLAWPLKNIFNSGIDPLITQKNELRGHARLWYEF